MYYYVYRITNKVENKHYYGKRSSKLHPSDDLGIKYFSSSKQKNFIQDQKSNPQNYKYKIVCMYTSSEKATAAEIFLHDKFDVGKNPMFYNLVKQTATKFDTTGVKYTEARKITCRNNALGRKHTPETKEKARIAKLGNSWNVGRKHTDEAIARMKAAAKTGKAHHNAKLVNIFDYKTNKIIAENVVLSEWCKGDKALRSNLASTLKADRCKNNARSNVLQAKGYYAQYANVEQTTHR